MPLPGRDRQARGRYSRRNRRAGTTARSVCGAPGPTRAAGNGRAGGCAFRASECSSAAGTPAMSPPSESQPSAKVETLPPPIPEGTAAPEFLKETRYGRTGAIVAWAIQHMTEDYTIGDIHAFVSRHSVNLRSDEISVCPDTDEAREIQEIKKLAAVEGLPSFANPRSPALRQRKPATQGGRRRCNKRNNCRTLKREPSQPENHFSCHEPGIPTVIRAVST